MSSPGFGPVPSSRRIAIAAPIRPGASSGNSVTADRWAAQLTLLGHTVDVVLIDESKPLAVLAPQADIVVALHARRCATAVTVAKLEHPNRPVIVGLAGTDLYRDLPGDPATRRSLDIADQLVVLQDHGIEHLASLDRSWSEKASVIHQSVSVAAPTLRPPSNEFVVLVLSHLRDVKDPLLAARATHDLPPESKVRVVLAGSAHSSEWSDRAAAEASTNDRFEWLGEVDREAAASLLANSTVLACTSLLEGGANVVSEAIGMGLPVIGTDIGGNRGLLGSDHPGLVPVGDHRALTDLLRHLESSASELDALRQHSVERQWMVDPAHEREQWAATLDLVE